MPPSPLSPYLTLINQIFDLKKKVQNLSQAKSLDRNLTRMQGAVTELGFVWHDPTGESYDETRTDCEASIVGENNDSLYIKETIKPLIWWKENGVSQIVQRAVVIVEGR